MARPKNSPEKIARMRNAMMDAVVELLDEVPPEKVSIRMIAEKIGVSHMVFYTYFKDRSEIMEALIERQQERIDRHFEGLIEKTERESVKDVLRTVLRDYEETAHNHPKIFRLFWMTSEGSDAEKLDSIKHKEPTIRNIAELLKLGMDKGEFVVRDPNLAAVVVLTLINAPIILHQCGERSLGVTCEQLLDEVVVSVLSYLEG